MLNDRSRTGRFLAAIPQVVHPGDVVVDLGTGTGILAIAAARAGARRVYAIEAGPVGEVARRMFVANGVDDRVVLVSGESTRVELPERADVLVTEIFGNGPLGESVLEATADARRRFLKPGARVLPNALRIFGVPAAFSEAERRKYVFTPDNTRCWRAWYGMDFSPLGAVAPNALLPFHLDPRRVRRCQPLTAPTLLAEINLQSHEEPKVASRVSTAALRSGTLNALVIYFELQLGPSIILTTNPATAGADNHWLTPIYFFVTPLPLRQGDAVELVYRYTRGRGERIDIARVD
ncbi:MAG TPA: 50S ribosomal protein L11 methyltransferase [Longimicrobium sp.]|jgi:precorrin-6B methylase 2